MWSPSSRKSGECDYSSQSVQFSRSIPSSWCSISIFVLLSSFAKSNLQFREGEIEHLVEAGIAPSSIDVVISNCVINLVPNKRSVLSSIYQVLREGGEFHFADMYWGRRPSPEVTQKLQAINASCVGMLSLRLLLLLLLCDGRFASH